LPNQRERAKTNQRSPATVSNPFLDPPSAPGAGARTPGDTAPCIVCRGRAHAKLFDKQGYDFLRCRDCGLVRLDPIPDERALAEVYERSYDGGAYAGWAAQEEIRLAHARTRVGLVRSHAPEGPWLDVGCSSGAFLEAASAQGIDIDGIDVSRVAVETCHARGLSAFHAAAEAFDPPRPYAYITGFDVLEHVVDPAALLDRLRRWLVPGGRIAVTVPDIGSIHARLMGRRWYYYAPPLHVTYFNRRTITQLLENHGFAPISVAAAPKIMTIDYITRQFAYFNPTLHRAATALTRLVPAALRRRELPISTGEILAVASA